MGTIEVGWEIPQELRDYWRDREMNPDKYYYLRDRDNDEYSGDLIGLAKRESQ